MLDATRTSYLRHIAPMIVVAIFGWAVFLWVFQTFFPDAYAPDESRTVFWVWLVVGTGVFVAILLGCFRIFRTPPAWRSSAAIALTAPALCLDAIATTFFHDWFPDAAPAENTAYAAVILGGVGVMQLVALFTTQPADDSQRRTR